MILLEIGAAILFVLSSGLLFNSKFKANPVLVGIAALFAIVSSVTLVASFAPGFELPKLQPPTAATLVAKPTLPPPPAIKERPVETDYSSSCRDDEPTMGCVTRLSKANKPLREATYIAYRASGVKHYFNNEPELAVPNLTTAIDNIGSEGDIFVYLLRGLSYLKISKYELALKDCQNIDNKDDRAVLAIMVAFSNMGDNRATAGDKWIDQCQGIALSQLGRHKEALKPLNAAIEGGWVDAATYFARARTRGALGDTDGSASDSNIAIHHLFAPKAEAQAAEVRR